MRYTKRRLFAGVATIVLLSSAAAGSPEVAIHSIIIDPTSFDRQHVTVVGSVTDLKETTSHAGNDYATFKLKGANDEALTIFIWGHPALTDGEHVRVDGVFETEHHAGRYTFYNEVEATTVMPLP